MYYVYLHRDNKTKQPFYVGMSYVSDSGNRFKRAYTLFKKERSLEWWEKFINCDEGISIEILNIVDSREEALLLEESFIKNIGKIIDNSGCLVNIKTSEKDGVIKPTKVLQYDLGGTYLGTWESVNEASHSTGISQAAIYQCLEKLPSKYSAGGYMWQWHTGEFKEKILSYKNKNTDKKRPVFVYATNGNFIGLYDSVNETSKGLSIDSSTIFKCLKGERKQAKGMIFSESRLSVNDKTIYE